MREIDVADLEPRLRDGSDYLTGGLALAHRAGAAYHVNAADDVASTALRSGTGRPL